jgi:hypothetical protein
MEDVVALMIPIVAITLSLGVAFWSIYWDHQKKRLQYHERQLMIERGMTPPLELPEERKSYARSPEDSLRRGTVMLFLGVGLGIGYIVLMNSGGPPEWIAGVAGAVVGFIGLGHLTYYFIARRTAKKADIAPLS